MISVENNTEYQKVWGGVIFASHQKRSDVSRDDLSQDPQLYRDILNGDALIYADDMLISDVILACESIRYETKKDEQGALVVRVTQSPDGYFHVSKTIEFITGDANSLQVDWWPLENGSECSLLFKKAVNGALVECQASEAEYTIIVWETQYKKMPKRAQMRLLEPNANIRSWVGIYGHENEAWGRLYMRNSFKMSREWAIEVLEPKLFEHALALYVSHPVGLHIDVEMSLEYYTNFESIS